MADQDHRAAVFCQRLDQRLAAFDVEVVGRLVEDQQVRRRRASPAAATAAPSGRPTGCRPGFAPARRADRTPPAARAASTVPRRGIRAPGGAAAFPRRATRRPGAVRRTRCAACPNVASARPSAAAAPTAAWPASTCPRRSCPEARCGRPGRCAGRGAQHHLVAVADADALGGQDRRRQLLGRGKGETVRAASSGARMVSIFSSILTRLWACLALLAWARKRSTKPCRWARRASCFLAAGACTARCSARWRANWS